MNITLWIVVCLFAAMGFVQAVGWIACQLAKPKGQPKGYYIISLPTEHAALEHQLRYGLMCRRWSVPSQNAYIILLDNGLDEEGQAICRLMVEDVYGVFICTPESLGRTLSKFDNLQTGVQRI